MRTKQRLDHLEADSSPGRAIALWLAEAHAQPNVAAYVRATMAGGNAQHPLDRLRRHVAQPPPGSGRDRRTGQGIARGFAETEGRLHLALGLEVAALEFASREFFRARYLLLAIYQRAAALRAPRRRRPTTAASMQSAAAAAELEPWLDAAAELADGVEIEERARRELELTYLAGASSLFPDTAAAWQRLRDAADELDDLVDNLVDELEPSVEGGDPGEVEASTEEAVAAAVDRRVRELRDLARIETLLALGARRQADRAAWRLLGCDAPEA
jgi:hypothetical protein